jgi:integron integrase
MEGTEWHPGPRPRPRQRPPAPPRRPAGAVRVRVNHRLLEVTFDPGFSDDDVAAVKAIPGSRWVPARLTWLVPNRPAALETLSRAMGDRVVMSDAAHHAAREPARPAPHDHRRKENTRRAHIEDRLEELVEALRREIRAREYSPRTEAAYVAWVRRFVEFAAAAGPAGATDAAGPTDATGATGPTRPVADVEELGRAHVRAFLDHLATDGRLAAGSRNQAAAALSFMFSEVMGRDELSDVPRAKGPKRVPLVLTHREVLRVLKELDGKYLLIVMLLYSAGLRLDECLRLRVKDIDFELRQILVRDGKGRKDRYVPLARRVVDRLRAQIARVAELHQRDRDAGHGWAPLPGALHRKDPGAGYELAWQHLFPAATLNEDPTTHRSGRWPLHPTAVQREVKAAVRRSGISKRATCHTFRHSFATETLRGGCDIRTLQHVMGHKDIRTTTIYLHAVEQTGFYVRSPLDRPDDPDDFDLDPIGRPWIGSEPGRELAARPGGGRDRGGGKGGDRGKDRGACPHPRRE